jgi:hemerythrin-like domain-containing protein
MPGPIDILKHEHRIIERGLRALDGICERLGSGQPVPPEALSQMLNFIHTFADRCHHQKEETHLFPTLQQHGVPLEGGPIGVMLYEHEVGRRLVAELDHAANAYQSGDAQAGPRFAENGRSYIQLLAMHIHKEDNILFKIAEQVLDESTQASLGKAFEQAEAELGEGTHEEFEHIATALERTWAL